MIDSSAPIKLPTRRQLLRVKVKAASLPTVVGFLAILFGLFPFTTFVLDLGTYNQPYSLIMSIFLLPLIARVKFEIYSLTILGWLLFYGSILFFVTAYEDRNVASIRYLVSYISPLFITVASMYMVKRHEALYLSAVRFACIMWVFVGLVQLLIDPNFGVGFTGRWGDNAVSIVESGRGSISLAPEPTIFGMHLIVLSGLYYLLTSKSYVALLIMLCSIILAISASGALIMFMALLMTMLLSLRVLLTFLIIALFCGFFMEGILQWLLSFENVRIFSLINTMLSNPSGLLMVDASVNSRIGGLVSAIEQSILNGFIPFGLSISDWYVVRSEIVATTPYLLDLSFNGFPSGYIINIYQGGWLFLPVLLYLFWGFFQIGCFSKLGKFLLISVFLVPLFQYSFANPSFWLFWGVLVDKQLSRSSNRDSS